MNDEFNIDYAREKRCGAGEIIFGLGKTKEQISKIVEEMTRKGRENIIITRTDENIALFLKNSYDIIYEYYDKARICVANPKPILGVGEIAVISAGTSDIPVAEEAAVTAELLGSNVSRFYDIGVAGIHRIFEKIENIRKANVVITVAGMEGAITSVVGGLVEAPVIAVPTSVGYGSSLGGMAALLAMLNSCASGVSVVNIDNGFGAGYQANLINKAISKSN